MKIVLRWLINAGAIFLVPYIVPGIEVANFYTAIIAALAIGLINIFIRPILLLLTLPINLLTLGLWTLVINTVCFWVVSTIVKGFEVHGFVAAFLGALVFWIIAWFGNAIAGTKR
jgi:putative membrane protein